jgi:hypothetical protein
MVPFLAVPVFMFVGGGVIASMQMAAKIPQAISGAALLLRELQLWKNERDFKIGVNRTVADQKVEELVKQGVDPFLAELSKVAPLEVVEIHEECPLKGRFAWTAREQQLAVTALEAWQRGEDSGIDMLELKLIGQNRLEDPLFLLQLQSAKSDADDA